MQWLAVALGGALGAMGRYGLMQCLPHTQGQFPWSTLVANFAGSLLLGALYVLIVEKSILPAGLRPLLVIGFLGALTTFSTFSLDAIQLWRQGSGYLSIGYLLSSVLGCLLAAIAGIGLTQKLF